MQLLVMLFRTLKPATRGSNQRRDHMNWDALHHIFEASFFLKESINRRCCGTLNQQMSSHN
jgi:hypothetical protein